MPHLADSNVIVRLLVRDDEEQFRETVRALTVLEERNEYCYVPDMVWIETCWVLEKVYKLKRKEIADALADLLQTDVFVPMSGHIREMLSVYGETSVDMADAFLATLGGSTAHVVLTWNHRDFRKLACEWLTPSQLS